MDSFCISTSSTWKNPTSAAISTSIRRSILLRDKTFPRHREDDPLGEDHDMVRHPFQVFAEHKHVKQAIGIARRMRSNGLRESRPQGGIAPVDFVV